MDGSGVCAPVWQGCHIFLSDNGPRDLLVNLPSPLAKISVLWIECELYLSLHAYAVMDLAFDP